MAGEADNANEKFSWRGAEVAVMRIGDNSYKTVIVGKCGNLTDRVAEAKEKGYVGITVSERDNLSKLAGYIEGGRFSLQKAVEGTKLPRFKVRNLIDSYKEIGIEFPEVSYPAAPKTAYSPIPYEEPAEPHASLNRIVKKYKKGRSMEREAFEELADIVEDFKKRLELLEKKK